MRTFTRYQAYPSYPACPWDSHDLPTERVSQEASEKSGEDQAGSSPRWNFQTVGRDVCSLVMVQPVAQRQIHKKSRFMMVSLGSRKSYCSLSLDAFCHRNITIPTPHPRDVASAAGAFSKGTQACYACEDSSKIIQFFLFFKCPLPYEQVGLRESSQSLWR